MTVKAEEQTMIAACSCGNVALEAVGAPMTSAVCYCDTCQEGARQLEALPNAAPVRDADGGTTYILFRKDRVRYTKGAELLKNVRVSEDTTTLREYAGCCNSAMAMKLADALHWMPVYRARFHGALPPLEFRICTKFRTGNATLPDDVPSSAMYPFGFMVKLMKAKIAMVLHR